MSANHSVPVWSSLPSFIAASPTPFHAVQAVSTALAAAGFQAFSERDAWDLSPGMTGFVQRNHSALIAFRIGQSCEPGRGGFSLIGAHTDSPALKLKLRGSQHQAGTLRIPVEVYGSSIDSTWLDRPLGIAGRIWALDHPDEKPLLVDSRQAMAVIPNLAIHLNSSINEGFAYNRQQHLAALFGDCKLEDLLQALLGRKAPASLDELSDELYLYVNEAPQWVGLQGDLLSAPRLDNLASCQAALCALLAASPGEATQVLFLADNEEVGSVSAQGANSSFLRDILWRLTPGTPQSEENLLRHLSASWMLSADAAHALHPSYPDTHDPSYSPVINRGIVVKNHASLRYASNAISQGRLLRLCRQAGIAMQFFTSRSDKPCGSTIGPTCSAHLGIPAVDLGIPVWAMHSCRETAGRRDLDSLTAVFTAFWSADQ